MATFSTTSASRSSLIFSSSSPVRTFPSSSFSPRRLSSLATATAVSLWSPVTITTLMPALLHVYMASLTSSRGGSIMPIIPTKTKSFSIFSSKFSMLSGSSRKAKPRFLSACIAIASFIFDMFVWSS